MVKRVYIDTSVFGGYFDDEFKEYSILFFEKLIENKITILTSEVLEFEIYQAPNHIIDLYEQIEHKAIIPLTFEVKNLALKYIEENVVGKTSLNDCQHIALATINNADVLASWNYKHIVNLQRIRGYNAINFREGYQMTEIRTPKEIFNYGSDS